jgi:hypothetical protein
MVEMLDKEVENGSETKEEFRGQRSRKRNTSDDQATEAKKSSTGPTGPTNPRSDAKAKPHREMVETLDQEVEDGSETKQEFC